MVRQRTLSFTSVSFDWEGSGRLMMLKFTSVSFDREGSGEVNHRTFVISVLVTLQVCLVGCPL